MFPQDFPRFPNAQPIPPKYSGIFPKEFSCLPNHLKCFPYGLEAFPDTFSPFLKAPGGFPNHFSCLSNRLGIHKKLFGKHSKEFSARVKSVYLHLLNPGMPRKSTGSYGFASPVFFFGDLSRLLRSRANCLASGVSFPSTPTTASTRVEVIL